MPGIYVEEFHIRLSACTNILNAIQDGEISLKFSLHKINTREKELLNPLQLVSGKLTLHPYGKTHQASCFIFTDMIFLLPLENLFPL